MQCQQTQYIDYMLEGFKYHGAKTLDPQPMEAEDPELQMLYAEVRRQRDLIVVKQVDMFKTFPIEAPTPGISRESPWSCMEFSQIHVLGASKLCESSHSERCYMLLSSDAPGTFLGRAWWLIVVCRICGSRSRSSCGHANTKQQNMQLPNQKTSSAGKLTHRIKIECSSRFLQRPY